MNAPDTPARAHDERPAAAILTPDPLPAPIHARAPLPEVVVLKLNAPTRIPDVFPLSGPMIVTIDGPAGTGKSSVARELANRLGLQFLDTGAMYRAAAAVALDRKISLREVDRLLIVVAEATVHFDWTQDPPVIMAFETPMDARIRDADVTGVVSAFAGLGRLRELMVTKQRQIALRHPRLVSEGRDQGSVVFPDAKVKFYLDASPQERARRRAEQLRFENRPADEARILREIIERDASDKGRKDGPLVCPRDAIVIDTTRMTQEQVVDRLEQIVRERAQAPGPAR